MYADESFQHSPNPQYQQQFAPNNEALMSFDGMPEEAFLNSNGEPGNAAPIFFNEEARRYFQQHPEQLPPEYQRSPQHPEGQNEPLLLPGHGRNVPKNVPRIRIPQPNTRGVVQAGGANMPPRHLPVRQVSTQTPMQDDATSALMFSSDEEAEEHFRQEALKLNAAAQYVPEPAPPALQTTTLQATTLQAPTQHRSRSGAGNPLKAFREAIAKEYRPMSERDWIANQSRQATASLNGDAVNIRNVRNTSYRTASDYTTTYFNDTYYLSELQSVDLIQVPFQGVASLAHVELSFGFSDGRYLCFSIEARYEKGESYDAVGGMLNQFELIYVIADERDMIRYNAELSKRDVHLYRLKLSDEETKTLFTDMLRRANELAAEPEFYHSVRNNCTSNIIAHINRAKPDAIPYEYRTLFSGYLDHLLYDLDLVQLESDNFKAAKEHSRINALVREFGDTEFFSAGIRQHLY